MMKRLHNDIVITGLQSWDIPIGSNSKNLALEFSVTNRVLYVNPPVDRISWMKGKNNPSKGLIRAGLNLWVLYPERVLESISRLKNNWLFDLLNKRNNRIFASEITEAMKQLGFKNHIHFCDGDMFRSFYLKELLSPEFFVYYSRDNFLAVDYWKTQGVRIEPMQMAKADLVVANSPYLAQKAAQYNPNSHFVGQGCDLTAFSKNEYAVPWDISSIQHPIIGYIGSLSSLRLDTGILETIATQRPQWNLVLVGPEDEKFRNSPLHNLKNVWFLGPKSETELPGYLNSFDVAINPQKLNDVTVGNYPRKIDEYLAMGKPVVATYTPAMEYFSGHVSLAASPDQWITCIERELKQTGEKHTEDRKQFASLHSWESNVNKIFNCISETIKNNDEHQRKN